MNKSYQIQIAKAKFNIPIGNKEKDILWREISSGFWEPKTFKILSTLLNSEDCALEVGIAESQTTFTTAIYAGKLIAIEPSKDSFLYAKSILKMNPSLRDKVILINGALSDRSEPEVFGRNHRLFDSINFNSKSKSTIVMGYTIQDLQNIVHTKITFINLDIEGGEYIILPSMIKFLKENKPTLLLSLHPGFMLNEKQRNRNVILRYFKRILEQKKIYDAIKSYRFIIDIDSGTRISSLSIFKLKFLRSKSAQYSQVLCLEFDPRSKLSL